MSESPDVPRVTPYQLIFGAAVFDVARFEAMKEQADAHQAVTQAELFMLPAAGDLLHEMTPPEGGREIVAQVRALLFHAYRHWSEGAHVFRMTESMLRDLIAGAALPPLESTPPVQSGYVQLPRHIMWARVADDAPPEPVDGFFWNASTDPVSGDAGRLDLLFALGVRQGRPGLSVFDITLESAAQLKDWATVAARPDGEDFGNVLPGGELRGYHAITTGSEALRLAALCLACIADPATTWSAAEQGGEMLHVPANG